MADHRVSMRSHAASARESTYSTTNSFVSTSSVGGSDSGVSHATDDSGFSNGTGLPLVVPTKTSHLLSGFPYNTYLFDLRVSPRHWEELNQEILAAIGPTRFDAFAASVAKHRLPPVTPMMAGMVALKRWNTRSVEKRVNQGLQEDAGGTPASMRRPSKDERAQNGDEQGSLLDVLYKWNSGVFAPLGLQIRLLPPESALKRHEKSVKKRKEQEKKTRQKYGTDGFYADEMNDDDGLPKSPSTANNNPEMDKRYKLVIERLDEGPDTSPRGPWDFEDMKSQADSLSRSSSATKTSYDDLKKEPLVPAPLFSKAVELPAEFSQNKTAPDTANVVHELPAASPQQQHELPDSSPHLYAAELSG